MGSRRKLSMAVINAMEMRIKKKPATRNLAPSTANGPTGLSGPSVTRSMEMGTSTVKGPTRSQRFGGHNCTGSFHQTMPCNNLLECRQKVQLNDAEINRLTSLLENNLIRTVNDQCSYLNSSVTMCRAK